MARSRQKSRKRKRRGTQGGTVRQAGRSRGARRTTARQTPEQRRSERANRPPSWRTAVLRGALTAGFLLFAFMILTKRDVGPSLAFAAFSMLLYIPAFYFVDSFTYQRRQRKEQLARERAEREDS